MCFGLEKDEANTVTARKKDLFVPNKKLNFLAQLWSRKLQPGRQISTLTH